MWIALDIYLKQSLALNLLLIHTCLPPPIVLYAQLVMPSRGAQKLFLHQCVIGEVDTMKLS